MKKEEQEKEKTRVEKGGQQERSTTEGEVRKKTFGRTDRTHRPEKKKRRNKKVVLKSKRTVQIQWRRTIRKTTMRTEGGKRPLDLEGIELLRCIY